MAEKARLRRARHKGGNIPSRMHKVNVEFYESEGEAEDGLETKTAEKQTVQMYDLMHKTGTTLKTYNRQDEEQRRMQYKLKQLGISSIKQLDQEMLEQLREPQLNEAVKKDGPRSSSTQSDRSSSLSSDGDDDLLEEFKRETEREKQLEKEREETRLQRALERKRIAKEKQIAADKANKKREKRKKKKKYLSENGDKNKHLPSQLKNLQPRSVRTRKDLLRDENQNAAEIEAALIPQSGSGGVLPIPSNNKDEIFQF